MRFLHGGQLQSDVKALARPTLRHRVTVRPEAELDGVTSDGVLDGVLEVAATYAQVKDALAEILGGLPYDIFAATAIRTYRLEFA